MTDRLYRLGELPGLTGGEVYRGPGFCEEDIRSVAIDSRETSPGSLFVPLKGERTDGHLHMGEVFSRGCRVSLVERGFWNRERETFQAYAAKHRAAYIVVASPLETLQRLAASFLAGKKAFRIGITGSNGKTTTKEIVGSILSREAPSFMNRGNLNSDIGLPLSVFEVKDEARYAVFEMGMNRRGEMDILTGIVRPQAALITNIGTAHIGLLGSKENIAAEKKRILAALDKGRRGYVYEGDEYFPFLKKGVAADVLPFGEKTTPGFEGVRDLGLEGYEIIWKGKALRFPLPGPHNLRNALGAISLCGGIGVSDEAIRRGIEETAPLFGRGQIFRGEVTFLQDCYNANPDSMSTAVDFMRGLPWKGRKVAVLASMKELGESSPGAHRDLGAQLRESGFDGVFLLGGEMEAAYRELEGPGFPGVAAHFVDIGPLERVLDTFLRAGDLVLLKGSRSMALERVTESLRRSRV